MSKLSTVSLPDFDDTANLRAEWLQSRSRLYDRATGLPTLPTVVDDVRRRLEDSGCIGILTFMLNVERQVEEVWGWQAYDQLIEEFVTALRAMPADGGFPQGILCLPAVRSDEVLSFVSLERSQADGDSALTWLKELAGRMEAFVNDFLGEKAASAESYRSHVGHAVIYFDPKVRVERVVYRGLHEARSVVYRRTATAEEHGAAELKEIIARRGITSVFQPIYDIVEDRIAALEALSRGPAGSGFQDAETLFSLAERTGAAVPLERLCRRRSLEEAARVAWPGLVFVNMSPAAASDEDFLRGSLLRDVADLGIDPRKLVIEVTERTYAQNQELFSRVLLELRREGFRIAVDDLGSGYSNLSALARIEPEFLKFDHLFTRDIEIQRIKQDLLGAILSFAVKMDTQVVAEGIETKAELDALRRLGVPLGQGFFLARPGPIDTFLP